MKSQDFILGSMGEGRSVWACSRHRSWGRFRARQTFYSASFMMGNRGERSEWMGGHMERGGIRQMGN